MDSKIANVNQARPFTAQTGAMVNGNGIVRPAVAVRSRPETARDIFLFYPNLIGECSSFETALLAAHQLTVHLP